MHVPIIVVALIRNTLYHAKNVLIRRKYIINLSDTLVTASRTKSKTFIRIFRLDGQIQTQAYLQAKKKYTFLESVFLKL